MLGKSVIYRGFSYKLAPTKEQESQFLQFAGVCRLIYNLALEQRRDFWRQYQVQMARHISYVSQARELTVLRAQFDWIAVVSVTCQQQALRDLDSAFQAFFRGRANYPSPRYKGGSDTFRFQGREVQVLKLNAKWSAVRLPKIGLVKFRDTRPMHGTIKNATVSHNAQGWHVSFAAEIEHAVPENHMPAVGIDRGVANTLTLSNGERLSVPASLGALDGRLRSAQRTVARRKRGSKRYAKAKSRVAKLSSRRARIRKDWHHRASLDIVSRFGTVILEDLKIKNMTASAKGTVDDPGSNVRQKAGLNRSILNQGWYAFETMLAYKLEERGGYLLKVDPAYTSQTCSDCGAVDRESRESQSVFSCQRCGFTAHADHNAAMNILRRNTASMRMEEGHTWPSDEVRTGKGPMALENHVAKAA